MSQRLVLSAILVVCVVTCGCGKQGGDELSSNDSAPANAVPASKNDAAATADRLSEWVSSGDGVVQPDTSAPQEGEGTAWATSDDATEQDLDASVPRDGEGTDVAISGDDAETDQGPSFDDYLSRIEDLLAGGDVPAAVELAQEAYTELTDDLRPTRMLIGLSVQLFQRRDVDGALDILEKLQETSDNEYIPPLLIQIYYRKSQQAADDVAALGYIQKSSKILRDLNLEQPGIANIFFQEAVLLGKTQQDVQAVASLREAFEKGYSEITSAEETFAGNEAALKLVQEFAVPIRERLREEARTQIAESETFPFGFELTAVDGETIVSTEELKGKVVIVDFWGTWCPPCREEIPHFVKLKESYGDDLAVIGVNFERGGTEEEQMTLINEFITANGVTYPCVLKNDSVEQQVPEIEGFPTTIFMDKDGKVRLKVVGYHSYDKLDAIVRELMGDEPAA